MEKNNWEKGIKDLNNIKLSNSDKASIFAQLGSYTNTKDIKTNQTHNTAIKSPWYSVTTFSYSKFAYAGVAFVLVFIVGLNTYASAQKSLPGDALYSLKVDVIEPLKYTVAVGTLSKANLEAENLATRFDEAAQLESQGKLTVSNEAEIETRIKKHADSFNLLISSSEGISSSTLVSVVPKPVSLESKESFELNQTANHNAGLVNSTTSPENQADNQGKNPDENNDKNTHQNITKPQNAPRVMMTAVKVEDKSAEAENKINSPDNSTTTIKIAKNKLRIENSLILKNIKINFEKSRKTKTKISKEILDETDTYLKNAENSLQD